MGALDGIRVLDVSRLLPGPYCSMVLSDHGAEVIAIEDRRYIDDDLYFSDVYRNKKHMTLNLKSEKGKEIFFRLADNADVILEGFRPGVVDRLGIGYDQVCLRNPAIIYCSISGYGQSGEANQVAGHDVNYLSRAGILEQIGDNDGPPVIPAVQIADIAGGSMNAVTGILLALYERERSGKGQYIDISMTDGVLGLLTLSHILEKKTGRKQLRSQSMLSHRYGCYNTYETSDGRFFALGAVENRFWSNLCAILGLDEFGPLQYDEHRREEIITTLRKIFKQKPLSHWQDVFAQADVCFSKIQNLDEVFTDKLFIERQMIIEMQDQGRCEKSFGIPVKLSRTPGAVGTAAQPFGGSTREILQELGYDERSIETMYAEGIL